MERKIILQKRDFISKDKTYTQYRINIPIEYVVRLDWDKDRSKNKNKNEYQNLIMRFIKKKDKRFLQIYLDE